jgi:hypothetical protein
MELIDYVGVLVFVLALYPLIAGIDAIWMQRHKIGDEARDTLYELTHRQ